MKNHTVRRIRRVLPWFNKRGGTETDFWRACRQENIHVHFWKLREGVKGFYGVNRKKKPWKKYIVINLDLLHSGDWLFTAFHELAHHYLHVPVSTTEVYFSSKYNTNWQDDEAEIIALVMLIPKSKLIELINTPFEQIYEFSQDMLIRRKCIFDDSYGQL